LLQRPLGVGFAGATLFQLFRQRDQAPKLRPNYLLVDATAATVDARRAVNRKAAAWKTGAAAPNIIVPQAVSPSARPVHRFDESLPRIMRITPSGQRSLIPFATHPYQLNMQVSGIASAGRPNGTIRRTIPSSSWEQSPDS
jgi:hypothetical protein